MCTKATEQIPLVIPCLSSFLSFYLFIDTFFCWVFCFAHSLCVSMLKRSLARCPKWNWKPRIKQTIRTIRNVRCHMLYTSIFVYKFYLSIDKMWKCIEIFEKEMYKTENQQFFSDNIEVSSTQWMRLEWPTHIKCLETFSRIVWVFCPHFVWFEYSNKFHSLIFNVQFEPNILLAILKKKQNFGLL